MGSAEGEQSRPWRRCGKGHGVGGTPSAPLRIEGSETSALKVRIRARRVRVREGAQRCEACRFGRTLLSPRGVTLAPLAWVHEAASLTSRGKHDVLASASLKVADALLKLAFRGVGHHSWSAARVGLSRAESGRNDPTSAGSRSNLVDVGLLPGDPPVDLLHLAMRESRPPDPTEEVHPHLVENGIDPIFHYKLMSNTLSWLWNKTGDWLILPGLGNG